MRMIWNADIQRQEQYMGTSLSEVCAAAVRSLVASLRAPSI